MNRYPPDAEYRDASGTSSIVGIIRTGLALEIATRLGMHGMHAISREYAEHAKEVWSCHRAIHIVGANRKAISARGNLPVVSFNVVVRKHSVRGKWTTARDGSGRKALRCKVETERAVDHTMLHPNFISALLNDVYGIQVRCTRLQQRTAAEWHVLPPGLLRQRSCRACDSAVAVPATAQLPCLLHASAACAPVFVCHPGSLLRKMGSGLAPYASRLWGAALMCAHACSPAAGARA
jgi:hypothetical protein